MVNAVMHSEETDKTKWELFAEFLDELVVANPDAVVYALLRRIVKDDQVDTDFHADLVYLFNKLSAYEDRRVEKIVYVDGVDRVTVDVGAVVDG
jgi:hypothetical protein